jgi:hypothetical protein
MTARKTKRRTVKTMAPVPWPVPCSPGDSSRVCMWMLEGGGESGEDSIVALGVSSTGIGWLLCAAIVELWLAVFLFRSTLQGFCAELTLESRCYHHSFRPKSFSLVYAVSRMALVESKDEVFF